MGGKRISGRAGYCMIESERSFSGCVKKDISYGCKRWMKFQSDTSWDSSDRFRQSVEEATNLLENLFHPKYLIAIDFERTVPDPLKSKSMTKWWIPMDQITSGWMAHQFLNCKDTSSDAVQSKRVPLRICFCFSAGNRLEGQKGPLPAAWPMREWKIFPFRRKEKEEFLCEICFADASESESRKLLTVDVKCTTDKQSTSFDIFIRWFVWKPRKGINLIFLRWRPYGERQCTILLEP